MTQRQDVEAAAKKGGWRVDSKGSGKGVDAFVLEGDPETLVGEQYAEVRYSEAGELTEFAVDDRVFGDAQTVGLADHAVAFLGGKALRPRRDADAVWDPETGGPRGAALPPAAGAKAASPKPARASRRR